jgi:hypothetical protein
MASRAASELADSGKTSDMPVAGAASSVMPLAAWDPLTAAVPLVEGELLAEMNWSKDSKITWQFVPP